MCVGGRFSREKVADTSVQTRSGQEHPPCTSADKTEAHKVSQKNNGTQSILYVTYSIEFVDRL